MSQPAASPLIPPDFAALASEACDMWQEHLATCSNDPKAREELMRLLEPSRRMFADWTSLVQNATHGHGAPPNSANSSPTGPAAYGESGQTSAAADAAANRSEPASGETGAEAARMAPDDIIVRLAQLAHRMAERMAELEQRVARLESGPTSATGTTPYASEPY
ncbi:MAG: hypothetical protein ABTQ34_02545 [Bdellovibrionales bacterium]